MNTERMKERGANFSKREHAVLEGCRLEFNTIVSANSQKGYANIVEDKEGIVEGILYEIKDSDIKKLDSYEGYPWHYNRREVEVKLDNGQKVKAVTYIANPDKVKEGLNPSKEYLYRLLKGCDLLSEEYCEKLRKWKTLY